MPSLLRCPSCERVVLSIENFCPGCGYALFAVVEPKGLPGLPPHIEALAAKALEPLSPLVQEIRPQHASPEVEVIHGGLEAECQACRGKLQIRGRYPSQRCAVLWVKRWMREHRCVPRG